MRTWRVRRSGVVAVCAALGTLVVWRAWGALRAEHEAHELLEDVAPQKLVHLLADFSLQPDVASWSVVEDESDAVSWRYRVQFSCGERCAGEARVRAEREHARAPHHTRVTVASRRCVRAPLLSWPNLCDESDVEYVVGRWGSGSEVRCAARARCSVGRAARGEGACGARLAAHVRDTLHRVRAAARHTHT